MARCKESLCHRHFGTSSQNRAILDAYFRLARSMYPFMWINVLCFDDHCCLPCQDKGVEDAKQVIAALRGKGISSIGAAGFCWGGNGLICHLFCYLLSPKYCSINFLVNIPPDSLIPYQPRWLSN